MTDLSELPLVRTSERLSFKRCRLRWKWGYLDRLRKIDQARALRFGRMVHEALEEYYIPGRKRGPHPVRTFLKIFDDQLGEHGYDWGQQDEEEQWIEARELGEDMLTRYVEHWRAEDKFWEVVSPELSAKVLVRSKRGKPMAWYLIRFDIVIFHHGRGKYLFVDHKTARSIPDPEEKELDEQCGAYWTFGPDWLRENEYLPVNAKIAGFLYNYLRKAKGDSRPQNEKGQYLNKDGSVSKRQPSPYFERFPVYRDSADRENVMYRVRAEIHEMNLARKGKIGIPKNPMFGGVYGCPTCPFYGPCTLHESGGDWEELMSMTHEVGDPYEDYRDDLELEEDF